MGDLHQAWTCTKCGSVNPVDRDRCVECGANAPEYSPGHPVGTAPPERPQSAAGQTAPAANQPYSPPRAHTTYIPPGAAPLPRSAVNKTRVAVFCAMGCVGLFILTVVIALISADRYEKNVEQAFNAATFESTQDIHYFCVQNEIDYTEQPDGTWEAKYSWHQSTLDKLKVLNDGFELEEQAAENGATRFHKK